MFKQKKWFWITFFGWCFITAVGSWALIFSPFHLESKETSKFSVEINGFVQSDQLLVCKAPIAESLEAVTHQWQAEGWKCNTGKLNIASLLLNLPMGDQEKFDHLAQLRFFEKGEDYRLLGFLSDFNNNQTYEWVATMPKKALKGINPSSVDFPLKPSKNATRILTIKSKNIEACEWSLPLSGNPENQFKVDFSSQGFKGRLWSQQGESHIYILQRGAVRLLALVEVLNKKNTISVVKLDKI